MGILDDQSFRTLKYQPYAEYGVGAKRSSEIWDAVEHMSNGGSCGAFIDALARPINVDRDDEGAAIDREE
jgi:hypothetical protein